MKLYNVIAVWDVYVVAESSEDARKALLAAIAGSQEPSEIVGTEVTREASIRTSWVEQKPFVGDEVSLADFNTLKGKATGEIFKQLYTKEPPK
jgi:hypothetical protein